jgi:hypothetical protein
MAIVYQNKNFAASKLASGILSGAGSLTVTTGQGILFPASGVFKAVIWSQSVSTPQQDATGEIVNATFSSGDTFTIVRAQESTTNKAWNAGDNFVLVITAGKVAELENEFSNVLYKSDNLGSVQSAATARTNIGLGTGNSPQFTGEKLTGLTASKVVVTDGSQNLASGTNTDAQIASAVSNSHVPVTLDANAVTLLSLSTQALGLQTKAANIVYAGPPSGGVAVPTFRSLVQADMPGNVGLVKQTEVDFGAVGVESAVFTVSDATVTTSSHIIASIAYDAPTGKDLDELEMDSFQLKCGNCSTGSFQILVVAREGYVADKFKINYKVG